jgi:hypothetical protein
VHDSKKFWWAKTSGRTHFPASSRTTTHHPPPPRAGKGQANDIQHRTPSNLPQTNSSIMNIAAASAAP